MTITDQFQVKDKSRVFQDKNLISYTHLKNRVNRDTLKIHEFDRAPSPVSPSNSSFNNSLFSIFPPPIIETLSPPVTFNLTERPIATATLFKDTPQNILRPATVNPRI